jgi:hypothetical protein
MKKILLSFLFLSFAFFGFAQTLSLSWDDGAIEDGATISVLEEPTEFEIVAHVYVTNDLTAAGDSVALICKKEEISLIEGSVNTFCWGLCYPPNIFQSGDTIYIQPGETNELDFSGHLNANGGQGTSTIKYTWEITAGPNVGETISVYIDFISGYAGFDDTMDLSNLFSNAYPNPANSYTTFDYAIPSQVGQATLLVHNLLGAVVKEVKINDKEGKLLVNTTDLIEGMYFYSIVIDNEVVVSRKLIIKR